MQSGGSIGAYLLMAALNVSKLRQKARALVKRHYF
jgi:hypothetical protein